MRFFSVFIILMYFTSSGCNSIEKAKLACMKREGASQADVDKFSRLEQPVTRSQKCFYACMLEKFGTSDGRRFDTERFLQTSEAVAKGNPDQLRNAREMADRCDGVENDDRCELAAEIVDCLRGE